MKITIKGIRGKDFEIDEKDSLGKKLAMLIEGHCTIFYNPKAKTART